MLPAVFVVDTGRDVGLAHGWLDKRLARQRCLVPAGMASPLHQNC